MVRPLVGPARSTRRLMGRTPTSDSSAATATARGSCSPQPAIPISLASKSM